MSDNLTRDETAPERSTARNGSTAVKLAQAAALAAMLVPLGTVAVETETITCGFYGASNSCAGTGATRSFDFGDYKYVLEFFGMTESFEITIEDVPISQAAFSARESLTGDYFCVLLTGTDCIEFVISHPDERMWSSYEFTIAWLFPTDTIFPNGTDPPGSDPGQIRVLQNPSGNGNDLFTIDMCLAFPSPGCQYFAGAFDPAISSGDTDFSSQIVASTAAPVPEPATLLLIGSGLLGSILRRRRKRTF